MDVAGLEPGKDFRKAIDESVASCSVLLAVIGLQWLDARDAMGRRRLDDANDFVRMELASALKRDIPVVPVLVRGAKMPHPDELPDDLKDLAYRNAVELTHPRWKSDIQLLIRALRPYLDAPDTVDIPSADRKTATAVEELTSRPQASHRLETAEAPVSFEPEIMARVTRELAKYIGPIAGVVVKRAAKQCATVQELCAMVAREIVSETDQARFLRSHRS
jgi:hypothetical protein